MEIPQTSERSECKSTEGACNAIEHSGATESDCAKAIAQAESVLREISLKASPAQRPNGELSNSVGENAESAIPDFATVSGTNPYKHSHRGPAQFGVFDLRLAKTIPDRLCLNPGLDFVVRDGGAIELTEIGFRRMAQAHSAGLDVAIRVDRRDVLRVPVGRQDAVDSLGRMLKSQRNT
jgi:hypothetical protein